MSSAIGACQGSDGVLANRIAAWLRPNQTPTMTGRWLIPGIILGAFVVAIALQIFASRRMQVGDRRFAPLLVGPVVVISLFQLVLALMAVDAMGLLGIVVAAPLVLIVLITLRGFVRATRAAADADPSELEEVLESVIWREVATPLGTFNVVLISIVGIVGVLAVIASDRIRGLPSCLTGLIQSQASRPRASVRPGNAPVCSPPSTTKSPLTIT